MMIGFSLLLLLIFGGVILALAGGGARLLQGSDRASDTEDEHQLTPRQVLDQRLARGEIDEEEYEAIRARLES